MYSYTDVGITGVQCYGYIHLNTGKYRYRGTSQYTCGHSILRINQEYLGRLNVIDI